MCTQLWMNGGRLGASGLSTPSPHGIHHSPPTFHCQCTEGTEVTHVRAHVGATQGVEPRGAATALEARQGFPRSKVASRAPIAANDRLGGTQMATGLSSVGATTMGVGVRSDRAIA